MANNRIKAIFCLVLFFACALVLLMVIVLLIFAFCIVACSDYENFQKYNGLQSMLRLVSHCSYDLVLEHVVSSLACLLNHKM